MLKTEHGWTVIDQNDSVLTKAYHFSALPGEANSLVAGLRDGGLMVVGPEMDPSDGVVSDLTPYGSVAALVAPSGFHFRGLKPWQRRFPSARVFAPEVGRARISKKVDGLPELESIESLRDLLPANVSVLEMPNTKAGELMIFIDTGSGRVLYGSHLITNLKKAPNPIVKLLWWISRSGPGFSVNRLAAMASFNDKKVVRSYVLDQLSQQPPTVFIPPHGDLVEGQDLADRLTRLVEDW